MKSRIDVIASEESFNNLSTFTEIEELNKTIRTYRDIICTSVKRADVQARLIALLEILKRHSCKQIGVSYMCKNTIADKLELSYKTVQRLVKKLEDLGMIRQVPMKRRKDMLQTSNAIIIVPAEELSDKTHAEESEKCPTIKTKAISLKQNIKRLNTRTNSVPAESNFSTASFIAYWVPESFANLAYCFYNDVKTIQELWKVVKQNNRIVDFIAEKRAFTKEQELSIGIQAFKEFVMKIKSRKQIVNIFGYFNGIVDNIMDKLMMDNDFMDEE